MSNNSRVRTLRVHWRKACAVFPAVALMGGGAALAAPVAPAINLGGVAVSSHSPAIVVPDRAMTFPAQAGISPQNLPVSVPRTPAPGEPGSVLAKATVPGGSSLGTLDTTGIPARALQGYRLAASLVDKADPTCHIDWALLAAIGRVESDHGQFGGSQLNPAGIDQPAVIGLRLDGSNGTARIFDPDGFALDGDHVYDHAVGPMQFLPSTWRVVGVDADGNGVKNPQSIDDAATTAAVYLCSGHGDLSQPSDLSAAIMRYNDSDSYVQMVTAIAATYRLGVSVQPASSITVAPVSAKKPTKPVSGKPAPRRSGSTPTTASGKPAPAALTTAALTTAPPSATAPTTAAPTTAAPTTDPTAAPTTAAPTADPTAAPTTAAPTTDPTVAPTTAAPTTDPTATASTSTSTPTG
jgi:hypothetical protein